jgi:hypothetical protein
VTAEAIKVTASELRAEVENRAGGIFVTLAGTADLRVTERIGSLLDQVHQAAQDSQVSMVKVDLLDLEFMNSSCFKSFVKWITQVEALPRQSQYRIRFISNPAILWQRRSLHALSCFAAELIAIEVAR